MNDYVGFNLTMFESLHENTKYEIVSEWDCELCSFDRRYVAQNMELFMAFCIEAHKVARRTDHWGAATIFEYLRRETLFQDTGKDFKINNNLRRPMSIMAMAMFPALNGLFEVRRKL